MEHLIEIPLSRLEVIMEQTMLREKNTHPNVTFDTQDLLNRLTPELMEKLDPQDIIDHMRLVYDNTTQLYIRNPHNKHVINELIDFLGLLYKDARVLDVGCGNGRDTLFMRSGNVAYRESLMERVTHGVRTKDKFVTPTATFRADGIDSSEKMIEHAKLSADELFTRGDITELPSFRCIDFLSDKKITHDPYDALWSCTSLFTHVPRCFLEKSMQFAAENTRKGGVFFTSYTSRQPNEPYDYFHASETNHVKYFSHQDPHEIIALAKKYGFRLKREAFGDLVVNGVMKKKDLFTNQFFLKE